MDATAEKIYGNRVRIRVCGLCWEGDKLLLVNHFGLYQHDFWAPPGGGMEFGQMAADNLEREFLEETGLKAEIGDLRFVCEFIQAPLHAIELFFDVKTHAGKLMTGTDPEMEKQPQLIHEVRFVSEDELKGMPETNKHGIFRRAKKMENIRALRGYLKI